MLSAVSLCVLAAACIMGFMLQRKDSARDPCLTLLTVAVPFAAGGFHGYSLALCAAVLVFALFRKLRNGRKLTVSLNIYSAAILSLVLSACITPVWATDRGMAPFGILRWLPVALYALYLMQSDRNTQTQALDLVPLCGAWMTGISLLLLLFPGMDAYTAVNGRLSGFFQYPNTFAAFLLAGLVLESTAEGRTARIPVTLLLLSGIVLSGSRTVFILLLLAIPGIYAIKRDIRSILKLVFCLVFAVLLGWGAARTGFLANADRYGGTPATAGTFWVRLLYFRDAWNLIRANPFGLGYLGYRALEGSIQTGRYYVTYVHNGFFQLLLDLGWIPALLMAAALGRCLFRQDTPSGYKLLLLMLLGHSMLDYDTEFFSIWIIVLSLLPVQSGKTVTLSCKAATPVLACVAAVSLWLGAADLLYYSGNTELCLAVTPFHTDAITYQLSRTESPARQGILADRILKLQSGHALALTAKANEAFSQGDLAAMSEYQEAAIRSDPYSISGYCGYIDKLYTALDLFLQAGDLDSARRCAEKILTVPEMLSEVSRQTASLAQMTGDDSSMILPEAYDALISALSSSSLVKQ